MRATTILIPVVNAFLSVSHGLTGQCTTEWQPGAPLAGINGQISAMTSWDPDGAGPAQPRVVFAGFNFTVAGSLQANRIAAWDPATGTWSRFGTGMNDAIHAVLGLPNGDLIAAGDFTTAGGVAANRVARWDGTQWSPFGTGLDNGVVALATLPNGDVVAGGSFLNSGSCPVRYLARWDGSNWLPFAGGTNAAVRAMLSQPNGDLLVAGHTPSPCPALGFAASPALTIIIQP